jgi:lysophospholipase L1-like esterase
VVKLTQEKNNEMMQQQQMAELIRGFFMGQMQQEKIRKVKTYSMLNQFVKKGQILFVGSSLMEGFPINEMQLELEIDHVIYNRGIGGTTTSELLTAMEECIFDLEPSKIFINIGSNDIGSAEPGGYSKGKLLENYNEIMDQIQKRLPGCEVYVMAYYPINAKADFGLGKSMKDGMFATRTNANIMEANVAVEELAKKHGFSYINVNEGLTDEEGNLKKEYSIEGLHLWPNAYSVILENMKKYL